MTGRVAAIVAALAAFLAASPRSSAAQTFEGPGTRAQGMAAFVAVADDASAVYWNPAGLASGAYFSLLLDRTDGKAAPDGGSRGGSRSSWLLALSAPVVGLAYYRLRSTVVMPVEELPAGRRSRVESLVTHHAGATFVQSVFRHISVGGTVKLVRGVASAGEAVGTPDELLKDWEFMGVASNSFDADIGVMASGNLLRAGLTVRNLLNPSFRTGTDGELTLDRQARAGIALLLTPRWSTAVDLDLTRNHGPFGDVRTLAIGGEGRLTRRAIARGGLQFNTAGDHGRTPVATVGATYATLGSLLVDAHASTGADRGFAGWGISARVVF